MNDNTPDGMSVKEILLWTVVFNGVFFCAVVGTTAVLALLLFQLMGYGVHSH